MPYVTFARQSVGGNVPEHSGERLLNMFAEPFPDGGAGRLLLLPSSGLTALSDQLGGPVRAIYAQSSALYAAAGGKLWSVLASGTATALGDINDSAKTTIAGNGLDVALAAGGVYYVWNGTALSTPAPGAFSDVGSVGATSGYIILFEEDGQRFSVSALSDATTINAADFASAEARPDGLVRGFVDHQDLFLFGTRTIELWSNTGSADFPFARRSGGTFERGLAFANAVCASDAGVWFVGDDRVVYRVAPGSSPQRLSTSLAETILKRLAYTDDVRLFSLEDRGHKFICVRINGQPSLIYDLASGLWHERSSGIGDLPWIATCTTIWDGREVIGATDGFVHILGGLTDGGLAIEREAISLPIDGGGDWVTVSKVKIGFGQGRTNLARTPKLQVSVSRDGQNWDGEREFDMGNLGEYSRQIWVNGLGRAYHFSMRLRITDPIDAPLIGVNYMASQ
jgi:hypothetical protein